MNTLVVYHSQFGNTRTLAETIGKSLEAFGPVRVASIDSPGAKQLADVDLLVVGGPTQAHSTSQAIRPFLQDVKRAGLAGRDAAAFDTRLKGPEFLTGSAAKGISKIFEQAGLRLALPPESFVVEGGKDPKLVEGENERAVAWATKLGEVVARVEEMARS